MKYGIIVDSGCDLLSIEPFHEKEILFQRVPLKLYVGEREYVDDVHLKVKKYMTEMSLFKGKTGSAAPSPQEWKEAFEQANEVFAITITGSLSGSNASAQAGAHMLREEQPDKKVFILDSLTASAEITLLVLRLCKDMDADMGFEEIVSDISEYKKHTKTLFLLESLDNLIRNGRIGKIAGGVAGILEIKLIGCASEEGKLEILHRSRGKDASYQKLIKEMKKYGFCGGKVVISHCFHIDRAKYLKSIIVEDFPESEVMIMATSGLCSYYAQQGGILIGFEKRIEDSL